MTALQLKELSQSGLYRRRRDRPDSVGLPVSQEEKLREVVESPSLEIFKTRLDTYLCDVV